SAARGELGRRHRELPLRCLAYGDELERRLDLVRGRSPATGAERSHPRLLHLAGAWLRQPIHARGRAEVHRLLAGSRSDECRRGAREHEGSPRIRRRPLVAYPAHWQVALLRRLALPHGHAPRERRVQGLRAHVAVPIMSVARSSLGCRRGGVVTRWLLLGAACAPRETSSPGASDDDTTLKGAYAEYFKVGVALPAMIFMGGDRAAQKLAKA